jgi:hypothetical protein
MMKAREMILPSEQKPPEELDARFAELATRFCVILAQNGIPLRPFESYDSGKSGRLPHFSRLSTYQKSAVVDSLQEVLAVCAEAQAAGDSPVDNRKYFWRSLRRMKLTPCSDVFDRIEQDDVIEIFTPDARQIFRSLNFFKYISCTLEELVSLPAWQVCAFPPETRTYFEEVGRKMERGNVYSCTFEPGIPAFTMVEIIGPEKRNPRIEPRFLSPIMAAGKSIAMIVVSRYDLPSKSSYTVSRS